MRRQTDPPILDFRKLDCKVDSGSRIWGPKGTRTARDVIGFYVFFLCTETGQVSPHFGAISLGNHTETAEKKENSTGENAKNPTPRIADFSPLSWSNVS